MRRELMTLARAAAIALLLGASSMAFAAPEYHPIDDAMAGRTITLTGRDLTIEQAIAVARHGAKVQLSPDAKQREADGCCSKARRRASRSIASTAAPATSARS
jgi:histidine ammonia-lyase